MVKLDVLEMESLSLFLFCSSFKSIVISFGFILLLNFIVLKIYNKASSFEICNNFEFSYFIDLIDKIDFILFKGKALDDLYNIFSYY